MAESKSGWAWPANARKVHYIGVDGRALCGRWLVFPGPRRPPGYFAAEDHCAECVRQAIRLGYQEAV